jgi:hypothetical protein
VWLKLAPENLKSSSGSARNPTPWKASYPSWKNGRHSGKCRCGRIFRICPDKTAHVFNLPVDNQAMSTVMEFEKMRDIETL